MARPVSIAWAVEDTAEALHAQNRVEAEPEVRTRLHALWLVRRGETPTAAAAAVGADWTGVQRWLHWYREGGLAEVQSHRRGGQALLPDVGPAGTGGDRGGHGGVCAAQAVRDWIEAQFGMVYAVGSPVHAAAEVPTPERRSSGSGGLEKGGLTECLKAAGLKAGQGIVWGDKMRPRSRCAKPCSTAGCTRTWRSPSARGRDNCGGRGTQA